MSKMGSHNAQAIPDQKMPYRPRGWVAGVSQTVKRQANKKRRQHGKQVVRGERYDIFAD